MIRGMDIVLSVLGILFLFPLFILVYFLIVLESKGGGFYCQNRVGKSGVDFKLIKFRSMTVDADKKGQLTIGGRDPRLTKVGYIIRRFKIDELTQLFNVLKGDMSFVGPRPEVRKYVDLYTVEQLQVLAVCPGITDYASIKYANENELLGAALDPEKVYVEQIMPDKIRLNMRYVNDRNIRTYFKVIFLTIRCIFKQN